MYEKHMQLKERIETLLNNSDFENARIAIEEYEKMAPKDMELLNYKAVYNIYLGNIEAAEELLKGGLVQYPLNAEVNYNMAFLYELKQDWMEAYKFYSRSRGIYTLLKENEKTRDLHIEEKQEELLEKINEQLAAPGVSESLKKKAKIFMDRLSTLFGLKEKYFKSDEQCIGKLYWVNERDRRYIGMQRQVCQEAIADDAWNLLNNKGEFLKVEKGTSYVLPDTGKEWLLPIALETPNTMHIFEQDNRKYIVKQVYNRHFDYYKVKSGTKISSSEKSYYGEPVLLGHDKKRKKLVLNLFVDGLSQTILNGDDLKNIMPYTYEFFKKGIICTNVHSTADWTYPSLASFVSGLDTVNHMQYHNCLDGEIPEDVKLISEYFQEAGYYTAKMDGDWRSTPTYGHIRGIQRYVYQNSSIGFKEEMNLGDIIEHIETFQDTDQYIWVCFDDLHNIADGYDAPAAVQRMLDLEELELEDKGETSVKQKYSEKKKARYIKSARHMDVLLNVLYQYILGRFNEDEILISLFADHGQGYLVPEEGHFICKERTNVAFMIRGGEKEIISNELISTCDYKKILCRLAGIETKQERTNGNLPVTFGGETEREFVLSESIHPKDPYYATYYTKDAVIYFENGVATQEDGRFKLQNLKVTVEDCDGRKIENKELENKYYAILLKHIEPLLIYED